MYIIWWSKSYLQTCRYIDTIKIIVIKVARKQHFLQNQFICSLIISFFFHIENNKNYKMYIDALKNVLVYS